MGRSKHIFISLGKLSGSKRTPEAFPPPHNFRPKNGPEHDKLICTQDSRGVINSVHTNSF